MIDSEYIKYRELNARNNHKLKIIGILPRYLDGYNRDSIVLAIDFEDKIPFSKVYNTYSEYARDKDTIRRYYMEEKEIPDDLFNKILETNKELGITNW